MTAVYLIEETLYGNDYTDRDIVYATLHKELAVNEKERLEKRRVERREYALSYKLIKVELTEAEV